MSDNMRIWDAQSKSKKSDLKEVSVGRKFVAINPQSQKRAATAQFGPKGQGWGVRNSHYTPIFDGSGKVVTMGYTGIFWWKDEDCVHEMDISSDITPFHYEKSGKAVEDWAKKLMTDATTKAFGDLGFNSDVFEGKWDGLKYSGDDRNKDGEEVSPDLSADAAQECLLSIAACATVDDVNDQAKKYYRMTVEGKTVAEWHELVKATREETIKKLEAK